MYKLLSLKQYLNEAYPWTLRSQSKIPSIGPVHNYEFDSGKGKFGVQMIDHEGDSSHKLVMFHQKDTQKNGKTGDKIQGNHGGSSMRVFSTVRTIIQHHVAKNPEVKKVSFTASRHEPSRIKLYHKLAPTLGPVEHVGLDRYGDTQYTVKVK